MIVGLVLAWLAYLLAIVYALTFVPWRRVVGSLGFMFIAIGTRLLEFAQRPSTPTGSKLIVSVQKQWERKHVEMRRDEHGVVVMAGGRFIRVKP